MHFSSYKRKSRGWKLLRHGIAAITSTQKRGALLGNHRMFPSRSSSMSSNLRDWKSNDLTIIIRCFCKWTCAGNQWHIEYMCGKFLLCCCTTGCAIKTVITLIILFLVCSTLMSFQVLLRQLSRDLVKLVHVLTLAQNLIVMIIYLL
jgi:hypothetical protein